MLARFGFLVVSTLLVSNAAADTAGDKRARVRIASVTVTDGDSAGSEASKTKLLRQAKRQRARFRRCAEAEHNRGWRTNKGTITLDLKLTDGKVSSASVSARTLSSRPAFEACLMKMMMRLAVAESAGVVVAEVVIEVTPPSNMTLAAAPAPAATEADVAERLAKDAVMRGKCLTRAGNRLARLARGARRASKSRDKVRERISAKIAAAQAALSACELVGASAGDRGHSVLK